MLKLYENGEPKHPLVLDPEAWFIEHPYNGKDTLKLDVPSANEASKEIYEEARITDGKNRYTVKKIDDHDGYEHVECSIDLDDWREKMWKSFRTTDSTLQQVFDQIKPIGWTLSGGEEVTKRTTIEASEGKGLENVTAETILEKAAEAYEVVFNCNAISKTVYVIVPEKYVSSGEFLSTELNLRSVGFVGNTTGIVTRLYPYGKRDKDGNPVTIASVNGGKEYIDNHQYTDRVIASAWSDERYTNPQSLLDAAKKKLDELSFPVRSYECDVRNTGETMYLYQVVTLIDRVRKKRVEHRVVTYKEYPEKPTLDVVTLSAVPPKIELSMRAIQTEVQEKIAGQQQTSVEAVLDAMDTITGKHGGHVKIDLENGNPERIRLIHGTGDETVLEQSGVHRNGVPYLTGHMFCESIDINPETGSGTIQLPEYMKGQEITARLQLEKVVAADAVSVLQSVEKGWTFDKEKAMLTLTVKCKMLNIQTHELVAPKEVRVFVDVIGR